MTEAEEIALRLERGGRSFRVAFGLAMAGLATIVAAYAGHGVPDVIRTKSMTVVSGDGRHVAASAGVVNGKAVIGTNNGADPLIAIGEGRDGQGLMLVDAPKNKDAVAIGLSSDSGSAQVFGRNGAELVSAVTNARDHGAVFIDNAGGKTIGDLNSDTSAGGLITIHDANGKEIDRVHSRP